MVQIASPMSGIVAGLFVGGRASRMGGSAKGLLLASDGETIVDRWRAVLRSLDVPVVLVGAHPAYAHLGLPTIEDLPEGIGPLGGLLSLLRLAHGKALALACDMPFVSLGVMRRLVEGRCASVLAPRRDGLWEPLCAMYDCARVLPVAEARALAGQYSLQGLLVAAGAEELVLAAEEWAELRDWDSPEDVELKR
jgi:molybdenum cofactor guanylyltransferase